MFVGLRIADPLDQMTRDGEEKSTAYHHSTKLYDSPAAGNVLQNPFDRVWVGKRRDFWVLLFNVNRPINILYPQTAPLGMEGIFELFLSDGPLQRRGAPTVHRSQEEPINTLAVVVRQCIG